VSAGAGRGREKGDSRQLAARGVTWNALSQFFEVGVSFAAMLVLVRLLPPAEYGRAGAAVGLLTLLNAFGFAGFVAQALQLPADEEPDWSLHWSMGLYIQGALVLACHAVAGLCWLSSAYRPIAPLLHLAALGFAFDWPARLSATMLRRELDFPRSKVLLGASTLLHLGTAIAGAALGAGAYALVLGANVLTPVPFAVDLLLIRRWRPRPGWWRWPGRAACRRALAFGFQQTGAALLSSARGAVESAVLPRAVGYASIGLLNRAQALSAGTVGRVGNVLVETAYPFLPRYAGDPAAYARQATLFVQVLAMAMLPGVAYVGLEGRALSRLLYSERWAAADPLIWPSALGALGAAMFGVGSAVLLARSELRRSLALSALATLLTVPTVAVAWTSGAVLPYAWALAAGQLAGGAVALAAAGRRLVPGWLWSAPLPAAIGSAAAAGAVLAARPLLPSGWPPAAHLAAETLVYGLALVLVLRLGFAAPLAGLLQRVPGGPRTSRWLGLPPGVR